MSRYRPSPTASQSPHPPAATVVLTSDGGDRTVHEQAAGRDYYESGVLHREWFATRTSRDHRPVAALPSPMRTGPSWFARAWLMFKRWMTATGIFIGTSVFQLAAAWVGYQVNPEFGPLVGFLVAALFLGWCGRSDG